ncbi:MAG: tRNA 2-thiouridine(34) synthase MnmA [Gammaproteobacteria bacterium]|nr:tRNA 2-thiouridine(34) synthase MnmA [Gammaproteobacteria bacterium]
MNNPAESVHLSALPGHIPTEARITVGMSGGVDSSVVAQLLRDAGYTVSGLFMKNWVELNQGEECTSEQDRSDAAKVAEHLGIPFETVNFAPEYWDRVFSRFLDEYRAGRTPNPDILCNREIKFDLFLKQALDHGADYIATGHYARVDYQDRRYRLLKAKDLNKDQTYFLYAIGQEALSKAVFPLGELTKPQVRAIAEKGELTTHDKKDSTGICFIGERNFGEFLSHYLPAKPGRMETPEGTYIAEHKGLMYYTLGQRKGLGIGGQKDSEECPWFVVGKKISQNVLVVAQGHNHPLLTSTVLYANELNWIADETPQTPFTCSAKTRYRQADQSCTVEQIGEDHFKVIFDLPQRAVTPGQSVVFYAGDECLGGGIIDEVEGIIYEK